MSVNATYRGKTRAGIQDLPCKIVGSPGILGLWVMMDKVVRPRQLEGGTALDRVCKVGARPKSPWTCVFTRGSTL